MSAFVGVSECFPEIGRYIKYISGGFHKLAASYLELRGSLLLESTRVKTMIADISKYLRKVQNKSSVAL